MPTSPSTRTLAASSSCSSTCSAAEAALLEKPDVAVEIADRRERVVVRALGMRAVAPRAVGDVADTLDLDAVRDQLVSRRDDVGDHEVQALHAPGRHLADPGADRDRARRALRGQLDDPEVVSGAVVDVQVESHLLDVERLRAVDVRDGNDDEFELVVHVRPPVSENGASVVRPYARAELICEADSVGPVIRRLDEADAQRLLELRLRNRAFMAPFEP